MAVLTNLLIGSTKYIATLELIAVALEATATALEHIVDICNIRSKEMSNETK